MTTIIVNNEALELSPNIRIPLNIQVSDAQKVGEILVSFTNSFTVPITDKNTRIFENSQAVQSSNRLPYTIISSTLLINGRDLFSRSRLVILGFNSESGWSCAFYAGDTIFALSGGIRNLDLSDLNFVLTAANAAALANTTSGVLYAPVNHGVDYISKTSDLVWAHFQVYILTLISRIFSGISVPIVVKNSVGSFFQQAVLLISEPEKIESEYVPYNLLVNRETDVNLTATNSTKVVVPFNNVVTGIGFNTGTGVQTIPFGSIVSVEVVINYTATGTAGTRFWSIEINGVDRAVVDDSGGPAGPRQVLVSLSFFVAVATPVTIRATYIRNFTGAAETVLIGSTLAVVVRPDVVLGNTVDIAASLPDLTQGELFEQIALMSNLIMYFQYGQLTVMNFDQLLISEYVDASSKFDLNRPYDTIFQSELGKITEFRYRNDNFAPSPTAGGAQVLFDNEAMKNSVVWVELLFAACRSASYLSSFTTLLNPVYGESRNLGADTCSRSGGLGSVTIQFIVEHGLSVGQYIFVQDVGLVYFIVGVPSTTQVTVLTPLASFNGSSWEVLVFKRNNLNPRIGIVSQTFNTPITYRIDGNTAAVPTFKQVIFSELEWVSLLTKFFPFWLGSMEFYRMTRCYLKLNDNDVFNFDFTRSYYIDFFGSRFYIQKINKYVGDGDSTEVELIELKSIIDLNKIQPL